MSVAHSCFSSSHAHDISHLRASSSVMRYLDNRLFRTADRLNKWLILILMSFKIGKKRGSGQGRGCQAPSADDGWKRTAAALPHSLYSVSFFSDVSWNEQLPWCVRGQHGDRAAKQRSQVTRVLQPTWRPSSIATPGGAPLGQHGRRR